WLCWQFLAQMVQAEKKADFKTFSSMNINLYSKWGEMPIAGTFPFTLSSLRLPGAELKAARNSRNGYCYIFQQFETPLLTIRFCNLFSLEKDSLTVVTDPGITFRLAVYRSHYFRLKELGKQQFHERQYNLFFVPDASVVYSLNPGDIFIFLYIVLK